ncbi:MAG: L-seryl-tRNA(Sec) selenium transferase [Deltaproteobacteria bacterium]|nr:L-seryl-tRNA(Sec) selenium transferase [Deltaproteobacteria bacterium]
MSLSPAALPSVDALLRDPLLADLPREAVLPLARAHLERARAALLAGELDALPPLPEAIASEARALLAGALRPVLNATGVVIHTNLGRAPWSEGAVAHAAAVARGYTNLELLLPSGARGGRGEGVIRALRHLTGAQDALVVNNGAAAVLLTLAALARGREVLVSRGELVEIGGSFRVPAVIASGGAALREVGATNRTHLRDYADAIGQDTALILKVHRSNFRMSGFVSSPPRRALAALARERGLPMVEDLGSGSLLRLGEEPSVREVLEEGADAVIFSGDKLLGGPQAGLIAGSEALVARLRAHPMYRALRVDKVILAALEATLGEWAAGAIPPAQAMLREDPAAILARAERLAHTLRAEGVPCAVIATEGASGGGALPDQPLPSWAVTPLLPRLEALAQALRTGDPAVVPRLHSGRLLLDARTLSEGDCTAVAGRLADLARQGY